MRPAERATLFWGVCVQIRIANGVLALFWGVKKLWVPLFVQAMVALVQTAGFLFSWASQRTVGALGGPAWWSSLRILHSGIYGAFVIAASCRVWWAGVFLFVDASIGAVAWLVVRKPALHRLSTDKEGRSLGNVIVAVSAQ